MKTITRRKKDKSLSGIDCVILCGGKGLRLRKIIGAIPKVLADIDGNAFLDILITHFTAAGLKRFIISTGYRAGLVEKHCRTVHPSLKMIFSRENKPLGTGGGLRKAAPFIKSETFLALNGDSFLKFDIRKFMDFHVSKNADISIAVIPAAETHGRGVVSIGTDKRVKKFEEKVSAGSKGFVSAGVYLIRKKVLSLIPPDKKYSLEYDAFPRMIKKRFFAYMVKGELFDIGTPEGHKRTEKYFYETKARAA